MIKVEYFDPFTKKAKEVKITKLELIEALNCLQVMESNVIDLELPVSEVQKSVICKFKSILGIK